MLKVMVVDDEMIVRKGIITSINWSEYDIEITAEAKNGEEAWNKLQEQPVDLILTDIRMPVLNGIDLARRVKSEYADIEVVMLSGYEDFQHANEAMSLGIRHYLLKPVMAEKLISTLCQIRDQQQTKRYVKQGELLKNQIFNENLPLIKSKLMNRLIHQRSDTREIIEKAKTLQILVEGPAYQVFIVGSDEFLLITANLPQKQKEDLSFAVLNIVEETLNSCSRGFVCYGEPGRWIGLVNLHRGLSMPDICEEIRTHLLTYLKLAVNIGVGQPVEPISEVRRSYDEAIEALGQKAWQGKAMTKDNINRHSKKMVTEAVRFLLTHYGRPIALSEVAEHVYVTPPHLSKVFKEEMGVTFVKWLNQFRMEEAKKLLKQTWLKTYEIADKVGFPDYKYFSIQFKQYTGYSPRDYRNQ
jgi:two-component system response regulator YesN